MLTLAADLRYALRAFSRSPGFTVAAVLSLALGVGATTTLFGITSALLLRPLPYRDADRLAILWNRSPGLNIAEDWFSTAQYFDIRSGHKGFEDVAIALGGNDNLSDGEEPERIGVLRVSSNLLPMLGIGAQRGRLFRADEDSGKPDTAVLSHGLWVRRYGSDPDVLGRAIILNGRRLQVIGVLPRGFSLPREVLPTLYGGEQADIFLPLPLQPDAAGARGHEDYNLLGRLKPGVTVRQAQAEMETITARLRRDFPEVYPPNGGLTFSVVPVLEQVVGNVRRTLLILLGASGFVLLIACVNVANLLLSRAVARKKEISVRAALGATRGRILRQLLTESLLLGLCGGALGVVLALIGVHWVRVFGARSVPRLAEIGIDGTALAFTFLVSVGSGALFGIAPALRASRLDVSSTLREADRGSAGSGTIWGRGNGLRRLLVIAELGLSAVLLVGAGLLVRSFARLQQVSPGFDPKGVLTFELTLSGDRYKDPAVVRAAYRDLWGRLDRLPGVSASGGITSLPLSQMAAWGPVTVEGRVPPPGERFINADQRLVGGRYFETMGIPLREGRLFEEQDTPDKPKVVLVDEPMARLLWPGQSPLGKRISLGDLAATPIWATVIGVVGPVKHDALDVDSRIALYLAQSQGVGRTMNVVLRAAGNPLALTAAVKREIREVDRGLPLYRVLTMEQRIAHSLARQRFTMQLLGLFAGVALALAAIGIYGVLSYLVSQGTREIGIRMALGATQGGILALVVRQGMALALTGLALGLAAAAALTRVMRSLLFGVAATDPSTFAAIALLLSAVALVASYLPARRASRIDPMESLRSE